MSASHLESALTEIRAVYERERAVLLAAIEEASRREDEEAEAASKLRAELHEARMLLARAKIRATTFGRRLVELGELPADYEARLEHAGGGLGS